MDNTLNYPEKVFLEVTTRCNLNCTFCPRNTSLNFQPKDFSYDLFNKVAKEFQKVKKLILNGLGEPLLHPKLTYFISIARKYLPKTAEIAFQSNGMLFTSENIENLLKKGLNEVCISLDGVDSNFLNQKRQGASLNNILLSLDLFNSYRKKINPNFKIGLEFVLMKSNYNQLPSLIKLAKEKKVNFILVTHLLPYVKDMSEECLFEPNTQKAKDIFNKYKQKAKQRRLNLEDYFNIRWKFNKSEKDKELIQLVESMIKEAEEQNILLHLENLIFWDKQNLEDLKNTFKECKELAYKYNISLDLPPLRAKNKRECEFVKENSVFIDVEGNIAPCYFLWHRYSCYMDKRTKYIYPVFFGNLKKKSLSEIWQSKDFVQFRKEVLEVSYPYCSNCPLVPCDDLLNESFPFEHDCYGNKVPCGHCLWCMGGIRCLR